MVVRNLMWQLAVMMVLRCTKQLDYPCQINLPQNLTSTTSVNIETNFSPYSNSRQSYHIRKQFIKIFQVHQLKPEIQSNPKKVNYLDINFILISGIYETFNKINNKPRYINDHPNHLPAILREISKYVSKRINTNSSNESALNKRA